MPMAPRTSTWFRGSVAVELGPLVFALRMGEAWTKIAAGMKKPAPAPAVDWEVRPTSAWNYGLVIRRPDELSVTEKPIGEYPFSPDGAPVEITVTGRRVPEWTMADGSAGPLPDSPIVSTAPDERLTLVPYGAAKLRVTAFPRLREAGGR